MAKATSAPKKKLNLYTKAESVEEYLARGGVVTVCEAGARTEDIPMTAYRAHEPSFSMYFSLRLAYYLVNSAHLLYLPNP